MSHKNPRSTLLAIENHTEKSVRELSTKPRLKVRDVAAQIGLTCRQLARLAKNVPGVERAPDGYHYLWYDCPETQEWIADRQRFRKGNRKHAPKRKRMLSVARRVANELRRMAGKLSQRIKTLPYEISPEEKSEVERAAIRVQKSAEAIVMNLALKP